MLRNKLLDTIINVACFQGRQINFPLPLAAVLLYGRRSEALAINCFRLLNAYTLPAIVCL